MLPQPEREDRVLLSVSWSGLLFSSPKIRSSRESNSTAPRGWLRFRGSRPSSVRGLLHCGHDIVEKFVFVACNARQHASELTRLWHDQKVGDIEASVENGHKSQTYGWSAPGVGWRSAIRWVVRTNNQCAYEGS